MSKEKAKIEYKTVPIGLLKGPIEIFIYGFFDGLIDTTSMPKIAAKFQNRYGYTEDQFAIRTIVQIYERMRKAMDGKNINDLI